MTSLTKRMQRMLSISPHETVTASSVRQKQEFSLSAETEYSAAPNQRIFGTLLYFRPKFCSLLNNQLRIGIINAKLYFTLLWTKLESCGVFVADSIMTIQPRKSYYISGGRVNRMICPQNTFSVHKTIVTRCRPCSG
jgi:hypothetical protein